MKTKLTLFAFLLALATLPSCHKVKTMQKELQLSDFTITSYGSWADIRLSVSYPGKLTATLYISQSENMADSITYELEKNTTSDKPYTFCFRPTNLQNATNYWCKITVHNSYVSNNTEVLEFSSDTQNEAIIGLFSINSNGDQVIFAKGNLQYKASTNTWRFANNQWDYLGSENENISESYSGWIDFFGWGTSNYDYGAIYYQPWSTSRTNSDYGPPSGNLSLNSKSDWGWNFNSDSDNTINYGWRTLTGGINGEWKYLFDTRHTTSGIRYAKAIVNDTKGIVLFPDNWDISTYNINNVNQSEANYDSNYISANDWVNVMEPCGCVFLPATGYRRGTSVIGDFGHYWSASSDGLTTWILYFYDNHLYPADRSYTQRSDGISVRLIHNY